MRNTVAQTERRLIAEVKNVESSLVSEETVKFCALNAEIMASKEALNSAMNASQVINASYHFLEMPFVVGSSSM